jgi:hypothetical protein
MKALGLSEVLRRPSLEAWHRNAILALGHATTAVAVDLLRTFAARRDVPQSLRALAMEQAVRLVQRPGAGSATG